MESDCVWLSRTSLVLLSQTFCPWISSLFSLAPLEGRFLGTLLPSLLSLSKGALHSLSLRLRCSFD